MIIIRGKYLIPVLRVNWQDVKGLYCWQLCGSISARRLSLPYQEKHLQLNWSFQKLVVCRLEQSAWSLKVVRLSRLQMFLSSRVWSNICARYEWKTADHSRNGEHLLLPCGHTKWNCEKLEVVTGSRKIISQARSHTLTLLILHRLYIRMSPQLFFEMNTTIQSHTNNRCRFITVPGIVALAVAFQFPLCLLFNAFAGCWKWIYIQGISIVIQLHVPDGSPDGTYKVVYILGCGLEEGQLFYSSQVLSTLCRMLTVSSIWGERRQEV